jgi:hypothetical protein
MPSENNEWERTSVKSRPSIQYQLLDLEPPKWLRFPYTYRKLLYTYEQITKHEDRSNQLSQITQAIPANPAFAQLFHFEESSFLEAIQNDLIPAPHLAQSQKCVSHFLIYKSKHGLELWRPFHDAPPRQLEHQVHPS